ncbi:MAG: HD domain-containing phosphohydrolase, partial [Endomicrobiia bacterium]
IPFSFALWYLFKNFFYLSSQCAFLYSIAITAILYALLPVRKKLDTTLENIILRKRVKYQNLLKDTSNALVSILDIDKLLSFVIRSIHEAIGSKKIGIFLLQKIDDKTVYKLQASYGLDNTKTSLFSNKKIIKWLETKKEPFILDPSFHLSNEEYNEIKEEIGDFDTVLILPLIFKEELLGFIVINEKRVDGNIFDIQDIEILQSLANDLAIAIKNAKLYKELDDAYFHITRALSIAIETKDAYTIGHSDNVTKYALAIAKKMNLPEKDLLSITQAAMLHDLGKIGVHDYILNKPDKLSPEEWEEIKLHSLKGAEILKPLTAFKDAAEIIKYHHEHYNGSGYPEKLKGQEIPLGARILAVADAFDAMISERPYRTKKTKLTIDEAVEELIKNKGTQFSPEIVDIFISILRENPNIVFSKELPENQKEESS